MESGCVPTFFIDNHPLMGNITPNPRTLPLKVNKFKCMVHMAWEEQGKIGWCQLLKGRFNKK